MLVYSRIQSFYHAEAQKMADSSTLPQGCPLLNFGVFQKLMVRDRAALLDTFQLSATCL